MSISPAAEDGSASDAGDVSLSQLQETRDMMNLVRKMAVSSFILAFPVMFPAVKKALGALRPTMLSTNLDVFMELQLFAGFLFFFMSLVPYSGPSPSMVREARPLLQVAVAFFLPGNCLLFVSVAFILIQGLLGLLHK